MKEPKPKKEKPVKEKPQLKQSETVIIRRSMISFNPKNPKRHTDDEVKEQLKNFKRVGFLGGIIFNRVTGNLIGGHKRLSSIDLFYGNTPETPVDYDVRVEAVELDPKTELEQMVFLDARSTNTAQDYTLLAEILPEIDFKMAGLDQNEMALIALESPFIESKATIDRANQAEADLKRLNITPEEAAEKKAEIKKVKEQLKKGMMISQGASYVTLSFTNYPSKCMFLEKYGYNPELIMLKGEEFLNTLNNFEE